MSRMFPFSLMNTPLADFRRRFITLDRNLKGDLYAPIGKLELPREILLIIHEQWILAHLNDLSLIPIIEREYYFLRPSFLKIRDILNQLQQYFISERILEMNPIEHFCFFDVFENELISFITSRPVLFNTYLLSAYDR